MSSLILVGTERFSDNSLLGLNADEKLKALGGNSGNVLFEDAVIAAVGEATIATWSEFVRADPKKWSEIDQIIIPCANQVGPHTDMGRFGSALRTAGRPVMAVGLGAQAKSLTQVNVELSPGTQDWLQAINDLRQSSDSSNIATRGAWSQRVLANLGFESVSAACPSVLLSSQTVLDGENAQQSNSATQDLFSIAVAAGNTGWPELRKVEQYLVSMAALASGRSSYIVQSDRALIAGNSDVESVKAFRKYAMPTNSFSDALGFLTKNHNLFFDTSSWVQHLAEFDLILGTRFHGVMAGRLANRPSVSLAADARVWELSLASGVPSIAPQQLLDWDLDALLLALDFARMRSESRMKEAISELRKFFESNGISVDLGENSVPNMAPEDTCQLEREPGIGGPGNCSLISRIEGHSSGRVSGWVTCSKHRDAQVIAILTGDSGVQVPFRGLNFRQDLMDSGVSSGFSGFTLNLGGALLGGTLQIVDAYGQADQS